MNDVAALLNALLENGAASQAAIADLSREYALTSQSESFRRRFLDA
jgi:hypothetical protein